MQHILISWDATTNQPTIAPNPASLWRDDQLVMWSFEPGATNVWWDPAVTEPIVFTGGSGITAWPGSLPAPIGAKPPTRDRRPFIADANAPNNGSGAITYRYDAYVEWDDGSGSTAKAAVSELLAKLTDAPIDPDIQNRPLP